MVSSHFFPQISAARGEENIFIILPYLPRFCQAVEAKQPLCRTAADVSSLQADAAFISHYGMTIIPLQLENASKIYFYFRPQSGLPLCKAGKRQHGRPDCALCGMKLPPSGQTMGGGENMEHQVFPIGSVIYEVSRIYSGSRPAKELVLERMLREQPDPAFDGGRTGAV